MGVRLARAVWLSLAALLIALFWLQPASAESPRPLKGCLEIAVGAEPEARCIAPASGRTQWFSDCPHCPEMVVVPRGRFTAGSPMGENGRSPREALTLVTVSKPFAVGRFAITFAEWDACTADGGCNGYQPPDDGHGRGNNPVVRVNWDDASAYIQWLSRKSGKSYRLLASVEREFVARAGTSTPYWWGSSIGPDQANYDSPDTVVRTSQGASVQVAEARRRPVPVDSFAPNPWGLYNVHGNIWEWTRDCWRDDGPVASGQGRKAAPADCGQRLARGGSWYDFASEARAAARIGFDAASRNALLGFRVARLLPAAAGKNVRRSSPKR